MSLRSVSWDISKCKLTGGACRNSGIRRRVTSRHAACTLPSRRRRVVTLYHIDGEENEAGITETTQIQCVSDGPRAASATSAGHHGLEPLE